MVNAHFWIMRLLCLIFVTLSSEFFESGRDFLEPLGATYIFGQRRHRASSISVAGRVGPDVMYLIVGKMVVCNHRLTLIGALAALLLDRPDAVVDSGVLI